MRVQLVRGVTVWVTADGHLLAAHGARELRLEYEPPGAAWWIALRRHDGNPDAAANTLARTWGTDPADTREQMTRWLDGLLDAGLLRAESG
ncbi:PqqD family protein [Streptomyces sp. NPDC054786]